MVNAIGSINVTSHLERYNEAQQEKTDKLTAKNMVKMKKLGEQYIEINEKIIGLGNLLDRIA